MTENIVERFSDKIIIDDIIVNDGEIKHENAAAPHGRLFEVIGATPDGKHRLIKEIACNIVVVGGAINALESIVDWDLYNKEDHSQWYPSTIEKIHGVDNVDPFNRTITHNPKLCLFGVGTGGCGLNFGSIIAPSITQQDVGSPIPFRVGGENPSPKLDDQTATTSDSNIYCMKVPITTSDNTETNMFGWYLKKFSNITQVTTVRKNSTDGENDAGEPITGTTELGENDANTGLETYVEITIDLDDDDVLEYFDKTGLNRQQARYNTIGFYTGDRIRDAYSSGQNKYDEFANVRLYSVINFNNRDVSLKNRATYIYRIYSLV